MTWIEKEYASAEKGEKDNGSNNNKGICKGNGST
jgi:hypothetical protein